MGCAAVGWGDGTGRSGKGWLEVSYDGVCPRRSYELGVTALSDGVPAGRVVRVWRKGRKWTECCVARQEGTAS